MSKGGVPVVEFDHSVLMGREELYGWGDRLRRDAPIAWSEAHGGMWVVSRYDDISAIARDAGTFLSGPGVTIPKFQSPVPIIPAESDAPLHTHYRGVLHPFGIPREVKAHEDRLRAMISQVAEGLAGMGEFDAVADFAAKIPARAMAMVFGFNDEDAYNFDRLFSGVVNSATSTAEEQMRAVEEFVAFLTAKLDERRGNPDGADVVSAILRYAKNGKTFDEGEILGLLWSTAGGAVDTTKHTIGHAIYRLASDPALRARIDADRSLLPTFVDEILRHDTPSFVGARTVAHDTSYNGVEMKEGEKVLLMWGWGNRDESEFPDPDAIDPARKINRHFAFGMGTHQCVGMHLAKAEIRIALGELLDRMPNFELADPEISPRIRGGLMWAFDTLPIRVL